MIKSINITNIERQNQITIGEGVEGVYVLTEIDWSDIDVEQTSFKVPFQIGETFSGVSVGTRNISVIGYVIADMSQENTLGMTWEEYFEMQERKIEENKLELDKVISIYQGVRIQAGEYFIDAKPTQPPKYAKSYNDNNEVLCMFSLYFKCYNPMFYSKGKQVLLAETESMFYFPLVIPPEKIMFGKIMRRQNIKIENNGDAKSGCIIVIKANGGTVKNPKIYNVNTNEFIEFEDITLNDGDYITINTQIGEESAIKHDVVNKSDISIIGNLTNDSKLIQIEQGLNYYAYEVEEAYKNNIEVSIEFMERYFNIRGM